MKFQTRAIHIGAYPDATHGSVTTPYYPTSTFRFDAIGKPRAHEYTRTSNPTRTALEQCLASLEGGAGCEITASGMAAITTVLFLLKAGDHLVAGHDIYGGTWRLFHSIAPAMGLEVSFVNMTDPRNVAAAIRPNTRCIWIETPSNPLLNLVDVEAVVNVARERGIMTIADNTFLSPYFLRPFEFGVDLVVHSTTKYINGHNDAVAGAVISRDKETAAKIREIANCIGTTGSPFDAWLVLRGVRTLGLRMEAHQRNAMAAAEFLETHPKIAHVYYPGLPTHYQHDLAKRQMTGFGGVLSFDVKEDRVDLNRFCGALQVLQLAESLGGVTSLIEHPWTMSHASMPEDVRRDAGISTATMRFSTGVEDAQDIVDDLKRALDA